MYYFVYVKKKEFKLLYIMRNYFLIFSFKYIYNEGLKGDFLVLFMS